MGSQGSSHFGQPSVSIAIPVYNGEKFIRHAIEAVLTQTYGDLELVITDNASEDATGDICRGYAESDPRVKYHRNEENIGLSPNFTKALGLSTGVYFKWLAADDSMTAEFVQKAIAELERDPSIAIATAQMPYIDEAGNLLEADGSGAIRTHYGETFQMIAFPSDLSGPRPALRFRSMLLDGTSNLFTELYFGLIRTSLLREMPPVGTHMGAEKALLGRLLLRGAAVQIEEPLLLRRLHPDHFGAQSREDTLKGLDPGQRVSLLKSPLHQFQGYLEVIRSTPLPFAESARAYLAVMEKTFSRTTVRRLLKPGPGNYLGLGSR